MMPQPFLAAWSMRHASMKIHLRGSLLMELSLRKDQHPCSDNQSQPQKYCRLQSRAYFKLISVLWIHINAYTEINLQDIMIEVNSKRKSMPSLHDPKKLSSDIKNHPCYQQWISNDMDYAGFQPFFFTQTKLNM